jgi:hypothetical protein
VRRCVAAQLRCVASQAESSEDDADEVERSRCELEKDGFSHWRLTNRGRGTGGRGPGRRGGGATVYHIDLLCNCSKPKQPKHHYTSSISRQQQKLRPDPKCLDAMFVHRIGEIDKSLRAITQRSQPGARANASS